MTKERIDELRKTAKVLFENFQTESEVMKHNFEMFQNYSSLTNFNTDIVNDLVDSLHSYDAAVDFNFYHGYEYFMDFIEQMKNKYQEDGKFIF